MTSRTVGSEPALAEAAAPPAPAKRGFEPRAPRRERGVVRYRELLDALEELLETQHPDDVGIYQIAEAAKAPPASTYHFFPTREAAFVALAGRHLDSFHQGMHMPVRASAFNSWLDLLARDAHASARYFNQHPAALKLLIGRYGGLRVRDLDIQHNRALAGKYVQRIQAAFHLPDIIAAARKFHTMLEIQDAIWAISYVNHGTITPDYEQEAFRASRAYIRLYYPEEVPQTDEIKARLASGETYIMPDGWREDALIDSSTGEPRA